MLPGLTDRRRSRKSVGPAPAATALETGADVKADHPGVNVHGAEGAEEVRFSLGVNIHITDNGIHKPVGGYVDIDA